MKINKVLVSLFAAGVMSSPLAYATNGMNLEGYGPVAASMGGASMAYDNGTAAVMNNPATLGLMDEGSRLDIAVGILAPSITATCDVAPCTGMEAKSLADSFFMPAVGYVNKSGQLTYGVGVFSQGGMGTEYEGNTFMSMGTGKKTRSEVGVGRLIVPVAYDINDKFNVAGSLDYVWAGMDLQMAMSAFQMGQLAAGGNLTASGAGAAALPGFLADPNNVAYVDFSDSSKFSGKAKGTGFAGKLGMTYKVADGLTVGATYHSETAISDLSAGGAKMSMIDNAGTMGGPAGTTYTLTGDVKVVNFQWPETYGIGVAYNATDSLMVVADIKHIGWKKAMKQFRMTFSTTDFGGLDMDMTLPQDWKDQNVIEVGAAFKTTDALTLRAGLNLASNPVPDSTMNPLFPAIAENHLTLGMGYSLSNVSSLDFSYVYVPKVTGGTDVKVDFGGYSAQLMYSYRM